MSSPSGVVFPLVDGRRSTTATGRAVFADALRRVDPVGAAAAERETSWRHGYPLHARRLLEAGLSDAESAHRIAADGLASVHGRLRWQDRDGEETELGSVLETEPARGDLATHVVEGYREPESTLSIPYRGSRLSGGDLHARLDAWVSGGVIEPSCADAVREVMDHPEWLSLPGHTAIVLGAASQMGPMRALLRWGAQVAAVDLQGAQRWRSLLSQARRSAGILLVPVQVSDTRRRLEERAGADVLHDLPEVHRWVRSLPGRLVLGNYVYADGETNVRLSTAVDLLTQRLVGEWGDQVVPAFLATPTDVFAVPADVVTASVQAYEARGRVKRMAADPLRMASGGKLLTRAYVPGQAPGISDSIVPQQGPNYLLAKRIQRWRAADLRARGHQVSLCVAPPTRTRSVVKNRALAAAYRGAHRFGVEVFDPSTSHTLMAALLVHDLFGDRPTHAHPWQDEAYRGAHGGLWRSPYDPKSALGLAAILGLAQRQ